MMRAIIVDDEQPALDKLDKLLRDSSLVTVEEKFTEAPDVLAFLKENKVDAVFLDIEMPDTDGIELASRIIDMQEGIAVVFVTAYNQYAVEAFRLNAIDYLMKPVTAERLEEALRRIIKDKDYPVYSSNEVHIRCFGKFSVTNGSNEVRFRTVKAEELLAFFIDRKGVFVSRREIIDSLWEDFEGDRAVINFNTTLHYVKKALLQHGVKLSILFDSGSYRLNTEGLDCDYLKFSAFLENAGAIAHENVLGYEETADYYRGEYLSGWEYEWTTRKRLILEEQFIGLVLGIADYYKKAGSFKKAEKWLKAGLLAEPLHREMNYGLIEILRLANDPILAEKHYQAYRDSLRKKLKQEPDDSFRRLLT